MKNRWKKLLWILPLLLFVACGGGGGSNVSESFLTSELYSFKHNLDSNRYEANKITPVDSGVGQQRYYFNFDKGQYETLSNDGLLFIDGKRALASSISYGFNEQKELIASSDSIELFKLLLQQEQTINRSYLDEYKSKIQIQGRYFSLKRVILHNLIFMNAIATNETFDDLKSFVSFYQQHPFKELGTTQLFFDAAGKLIERDERGQESSAGSYEVKNIDGREVLLLSPNNLNKYSKECYLLDFSKVWRSSCYLKGEEAIVNYYNRDIFNNVEQYMQTNFKSIQLNI